MKKFISVLCACAIVASTLVSCSAKPSSSTPSQGSLANGASKVGDKNVTLTVYAGVATMKDAVDTIVADYKAATGVSIEWEIPGDEPYTLLKTRFASNEAPDIFDLANGDFATWSVRCEDLTGAAWIEHADKTALSASTIDGKIYGFPYAVEGNGIVYNKELFKQAGIDKIPQTLTELEAVCEKLKAAGIQPFGEAFKEWGFLMHMFGIPLAYEKDAKAFCEAMEKGEKTFAELEYIDNFFRLYDMTLKYGKGAESIGYGAMDQVADFANGKMAMIKQGTWYGDPLWATNPELSIGLFAAPITDSAEDTKLLTSATRFYSIANTSDKKEEAKALLIWLQENAQKYFVDSSMRAAIPFDNVNLENLGTLNEDMQKYLSDGKAFPIFGTEYLPSGFVTDIAAPLQAYAAGVTDKAATIEALQKAYENRIAAQS